MTENKESRKKGELLRLLSDTEQQAQDLKSKGHEIVEQGQSIEDLAHCSKDFIKCVPDDSFLSNDVWDYQISSWSALNETAADANKAYDKTKPLVLLAVDSTNVATTAVISSVTIAALPTHERASARSAFEQYEHLLEQSDLIEKIKLEISRLGLISSKSGYESILSLVQQSNKAFKVPSLKDVSPSAVLIPLREALNRAIADLLPRRRKQEKARNHTAKVQSICSQCCYSAVDPRQIEELAKQIDDLNGQMSGAKQSSMTRDQVRELMNRGLVFLLTFLRMLDENKLSA
jgi:hypothetical protein